MGELKPCPFCGASSASILIHAGSNSTYRVECGVCYISTGQRGNQTEACEAWNTRAAPRPAPLDDAKIAELLAVADAYAPDMLTMQPDGPTEIIRDLTAALRAERERREEAEAALRFYADPESYHAITIWSDPPSGEFANDFSGDHGHPDYDRPMPGARARAALNGDPQ